MKKTNTNTNTGNQRKIREVREDRLTQVQGGEDLKAPSPDAQRKE